MNQTTYPERLDRARELARLMDRAVRIPGTRFRVGLDGIIGLMPGFGDVAGAVIAAYPLWVGARAGAPPEVLLRMLGNLAVDAVLGAVPILGDIFDFAWKANSRNVQLLEGWTEEPGRVRRSSRFVVGAILAGALLLVALLAWAAFVIGTWIFGGIERAGA